MIISIGRGLVKFDPTLIWQNNPKYKNWKLAQGPKTIGRYGCALACMLGIFNIYCGSSLNLQEFNELMNSRNGFFDSMVIWGKLTEMVNCLQKCSSNSFNDSPANLELLRFPCVVRIDYNPKTREDDWHYVLAISYIGNDLLIVDPINGKTEQLLHKYGFPDGGLGRAIYQIVRYE